MEPTSRSKDNNTIDFLLTYRRDQKAAKRFFDKAIKGNAPPEEINIDKRGANGSAVQACDREKGVDIEIRQVEYPNNIIEQDP